MDTQYQQPYNGARSPVNWWCSGSWILKVLINDYFNWYSMIYLTYALDILVAKFSYSCIKKKWHKYTDIFFWVILTPLLTTPYYGHWRLNYLKPIAEQDTKCSWPQSPEITLICMVRTGVQWSLWLYGALSRLFTKDTYLTPYWKLTTC